MARSRSASIAPAREGSPLVDALVRTASTVTAVLNNAAAENDLGLERSTMSGFVERVEKRRLLDRAPSEHDRRAVEASISSAGREVATRMYAQVDETLVPALEALGVAERARLETRFTRMLAS